MKKKLLIFGGSRLIGKEFVTTYSENYEITVANRGNRNAGLPETLSFMQLDRYDAYSMSTALKGTIWDVVIDCLCYSPTHARILLEIPFEFKKLICISTISVYQGSGPFFEENFQPEHYEYQCDVPVASYSGTPKEGELSYGEGKRQAEAFYLKEGKGNVIFLRFPIVIGVDDYTHRVQKHRRYCEEGLSLFFGNSEHQVSFIDVRDAAQAISIAVEKIPNGIVNAAADAIQLKEFITLLDKHTDGQLRIVTSASEGKTSSFAFSFENYMDCSKIKEYGFKPACILASFNEILSTSRS